MCWLVVKDKGYDIPDEYMETAKRFNSDGYGVSWYEDNRINTFRTFNWDRFKIIVSSLTDSEAIVHLRNATAGSVTFSNIHPFELDSGSVMYHNGTIFNLKGTTISDSQALANIIDDCTYEHIEDILPLIQNIVGDTINRLVFMDDDGFISIVNEDLGIQEDGIWYSNDYHTKDIGWSRGKTTYESPYKMPTRIPPKPSVPEIEYTDLTPEEIKDICAIAYEDEPFNALYRVFVYGTLKRGYNNNQFLNGATYLGKGISFEPWAMEGHTMSFPYLLGPCTEGYNVKGELYLVDDDILKKLDMLEGYPTHYKYDMIEVLDEEGEMVEAMSYVKTGTSLATKKDYIEEWPTAV